MPDPHGINNDHNNRNAFWPSSSGPRHLPSFGRRPLAVSTLKPCSADSDFAWLRNVEDMFVYF